MATPRLLTQIEAAEVLGCSPTKVKDLRLSGKLTYLPGRPVLIDADDLDKYIEDKKAEELARNAPKDPLVEAARRARETWMLRQLRMQFAKKREKT